MWHDLVHMGIGPGEKAIRTVAVYGGLLVLLHLAGKRSLAQLNSFDLVVLLLLSNVVQNAIIGSDDSLAGGLLGAAILVAANALLVRFAFMSPRFGKALQGGSTTLFADGEVDERALRRTAITREELVAGLRRQGLELADVERVVLEPEGALNATPRPKPGIEDVLRKLDALERRLSA
ncbi:MAG TPA: YetF domain-containing protein [Gaiellaceae bacterium]|nr:YetF domain-containing protein [Gaiellaceae bacterium]